MSSRIGTVPDGLVSQVVGGFQSAIESKVEDLANDVKRAIGAPVGTTGSRNYGFSANTGAPGAQASASSFDTATSDGAGMGVPRAD